VHGNGHRTFQQQGPDGDWRNPILDCRNVAKAFGGVQALRGVDFAITPGRVHGLVGENGAGKSTLLKILAGVVLPDTGSITLNGERYAPAGTEAALRHGVVTVHQDINLIESLTVAENVLLNNEPTRGGLLRGREMRERTAALLASYGIDVDPSALVSTLPTTSRRWCRSSRRRRGIRACCCSTNRPRR